MTNEPIDRHFGIPMSEWIARVPNELEIDAVGLWQIIPVGIDSFMLSGADLEEFAARCIVALLQKGAVPVKSDCATGEWVHDTKYHGSAHEIALQIIDDWRAGRATADTDGLWFALHSPVGVMTQT